MSNDQIQDENGGEGGGEATKFVEVDGNKFVDDGSGKPKLGEDGKPIAFKESDKPAETPEAKKIRLERMQEQHRAKHPELYQDNEGDKKGKKGKKSEELGYGEKAFLVANGIKGTEETALVKKIMDSTGNSMETVLESKYFQAELKELRDAKAAADATPGKSGRQGNSASNTVEYWMAKGELPPNTPENRELRQKVVNARLAAERAKSEFTDNPVAGSGARR